MAEGSASNFRTENRGFGVKNGGPFPRNIDKFLTHIT